MAESIEVKHADRLALLRQEVVGALNQQIQVDSIPYISYLAVSEAASYTELRTEISNLLSMLDRHEPWAGRFWLIGSLTSISNEVSKALDTLEKDVFGIKP